MDGKEVVCEKWLYCKIWGSLDCDHARIHKYDAVREHCNRMTCRKTGFKVACKRIDGKGKSGL